MTDLDLTLPTPGVTNDWGDMINTALEALKGEINGRLGQSQLAGTIVSKASLRNRWAFLGDSMVASGYSYIAEGVGNLTRTDSWATYAGIASRGRITDMINLGKGGDTSQAMLDRWDADVVPNADLFDVLCIQLSTNDGGGGVTLATSIANETELITKAQALGKQVVVVGIGPNINEDDARRDAQVLRNSWARTYCARRGIPFVDYYDLVVDQTTGGFKSGYSDDGTHLNATSRPIVGQRFLDKILPFVPDVEAYLSSDPFDGSNLFVTSASLEPTWATDATSNGIPDGWSSVGASTGRTDSLEAPDADSNSIGHWYRIVSAATGSAAYIQPGTRPAITAGNTYEFTFGFRINSMSSGYAQVQVRWMSAASGGTEVRRDYPLYQIEDVMTGIVRFRAVAPAGATHFTTLLQAGAGTSSIDYCLPTLRDLTVLGLD